MRQHSLLLILIVFLGLLFSTNAQEYPDTLWIKVTFYDFHADGSNPEFEPASPRIGVVKNMVAETLSADRKPTLGSAINYNAYINKWFRPWSQGDFTIPVYSGANGSTMTPTTVDYDTAFKNVVIVDSLPFIHTGGGMYSFERSGSNGTPDFFWIDGKGFGNEPSGYEHNFSFSMELHTTFTFKKGMSFDFLGDDDVWAYINGKLAMDLGGIHQSTRGTISLDDIAEAYNLEEGKTFPFDFFYVERHVSRSTIKVMTNLFTPVANLRFYSKSGTPDVNGNNAITDTYNVLSGEPITVYTHVFDSTAWKPEWDPLVTWVLSDSKGTVATGKSTNNGAIELPPGKAYTEYLLTVKFINPDDPTKKENTSTLRISFGPGKPYQITFQETLDTIQLETSHLTSLTIGKNKKTDTLYAVVRDSAGYFLRFAVNASWNSSNTSAATVSAVSNAAHKGIIKKESNGTTKVTATENGLKPAVIDVILEMDPTIITVTPSSNPVLSGTQLKDVLPEEILKIFTPVIKAQNKTNSTEQFIEGVIIAIHVTGTPLLQINEDNKANGTESYGKARLYDALGNLIRNDLDVYKTTDTDYGIYWNLRNKNNRKVGSGTYLAKFGVKNLLGDPELFSIKIGVKDDL